MQDHRRDRGWRLELHGHAIALADLPPGDAFCVVLRDPITRCVSGFNSRRRKGYPAHHSEWNRAERAAFDRFATINELALALGSADPEAKAAAERAMAGIRHVNSRLADWLGPPEQLEASLQRACWIGRQESLAADFEQLKRRLGLPQNLQLPAGAQAHRAPGGEDILLEPAALDNLRRWYREDYRLLAVAEQWRSAHGLGV